MRSRVPAALRGLCLMFAALVVALWVRSYFVSDTYMWQPRPDQASFNWGEARAVTTAPGKLVVRGISPFM